MHCWGSPLRRRSTSVMRMVSTLGTNPLSASRSPAIETTEPYLMEVSVICNAVRVIFICTDQNLDPLTAAGSAQFEPPPQAGGTRTMSETCGQSFRPRSHHGSLLDRNTTVVLLCTMYVCSPRCLSVLVASGQYREAESDSFGLPHG